LEYLLHILILIGIYVILSVSLDLIAGFTGLLSLAHAAFYGIGAYTAALMALRLGSPFWLTLPTAAVLCAILGLVVGVPSLRIRDDYFAIVTFGLQVIVFSILNNWVSFTGGAQGLPGIPDASLFGVAFSSTPKFLLLTAIVASVTVWVVCKTVNSPFGRVLKAVREDEVFALAAGKYVARYKVLVSVLSAGMAGVAGVLYAYYISFIDPTSFTIIESIFIISIVIIGGAGSIRGPIVGAVVLVLLPELLRFIGLPSAVAANLRQVLYGGLLVIFMLWRPQGLFGEFTFRQRETNP